MAIDGEKDGWNILLIIKDNKKEWLKFFTVKVASRLKMIAFKRYRCPEKCPKKLRREKGNCCLMSFSMSFLLFGSKEHLVRLKSSGKKCLKQYKSIKFCWCWRKHTRPPSWKCCSQISSRKFDNSDNLKWKAVWKELSHIMKKLPNFLYTESKWYFRAEWPYQDIIQVSTINYLSALVRGMTNIHLFSPSIISWPFISDSQVNK